MVYSFYSFAKLLAMSAVILNMAVVNKEKIDNWYSTAERCEECYSRSLAAVADDNNHRVYEFGRCSEEFKSPNNRTWEENDNLLWKSDWWSSWGNTSIVNKMVWVPSLLLALTVLTSCVMLCTVAALVKADQGNDQGGGGASAKSLGISLVINLVCVIFCFNMGHVAWTVYFDGTCFISSTNVATRTAADVMLLLALLCGANTEDKNISLALLGCRFLFATIFGALSLVTAVNYANNGIDVGSGATVMGVLLFLSMYEGVIFIVGCAAVVAAIRYFGIMLGIARQVTGQEANAANV